MKRTILLIALVPLLAACTATHDLYDRIRFGENPYEEPPFYARYLRPDSDLDARIWELLGQLRENPQDPQLHNELGTLLLSKGFPNDAEREFLRAIRTDDRLYPAWYNLGLIRYAKGEEGGALRAFRRTVDLRPGHPAAHFQLGLLYEDRGQTDRAIEHYARSLAINPSMLDVRVNPRVVDTKLLDRALLLNYETTRSRASAVFQTLPEGYLTPEERQALENEPEAASPQAEAEDIVTPAPSIPEQVEAGPN